MVQTEGLVQIVLQVWVEEVEAAMVWITLTQHRHPHMVSLVPLDPAALHLNRHIKAMQQ
jgi:hypothetical protein